MQNLVVLEKAISLGNGGPLATELRAEFQGRPVSPRIDGFIIGLGGRDVTMEAIENAIVRAQQQPVESEFIDLREDVELEGINA